MVYTDGVHLTADSLDELYGYASKIGLNPNWIDFGGRSIHPHFHICGRVKQRVLEDINVKKVTCREIVKECIRNFRLPESFDDLHEDKSHKKDALLNFQMPSSTDYERMIENIFLRVGIRRS